MKYLILMIVLLSPSFGADLMIIEITSDLSFNYFFSIFFNISLVLVPIFGAISLLRN